MVPPGLSMWLVLLARTATDDSLRVVVLLPLVPVLVVVVAVAAATTTVEEDDADGTAAPAEVVAAAVVPRVGRCCFTSAAAHAGVARAALAVPPRVESGRS
jgi:hypothetical protein